jgi:hypothetical protein
LSVQFPTDAEAIAYLRTPRAIRERCAMVFAAAERGETEHFALDLKKLSACTHYVARVMQDNYPKGDVPFHARWRHFAVGGVDRWKPLARRFVGRDPIEMVRAAYDLAIVSVLLDAGSGPDWKYKEPGTGAVFTRSEGLAVASIDMFAAGAFSADADDPLRVDAGPLQALSVETLARGFQVATDNPLVGLEGRVGLLQGSAVRSLRSPGCSAAKHGSAVSPIISWHRPKAVCCRPRRSSSPCSRGSAPYGRRAPFSAASISAMSAATARRRPAIAATGWCRSTSSRSG